MTEDKNQIKPFLRVFNTDLIGNKPIYHALLKITGVGFSMANSVCNVLKLDKKTKAGLLSEQDARKIEDVIKNQMPIWMQNRRSEFLSNETRHLLGGDLKFEVDNDIKRLKKIKSYKGIRHATGQPVRGQRTRSHFRHGRAVGVQKTKAPSSAAAGGDKKAGDKKK